MNTFTITNSRGVPFTVRFVSEGDSYGLNDCLTHDDSEPLVEFYDQRYPHTKHGQFVSRYSASTLATMTGAALALDYGTPDWMIDGPGLQRVIGAAIVLT